MTSFDPADNWIFGPALDPNSLPGPPTDTLVGHTYAASGDYLAFTESGARISGSGGHINNPDGIYRVETIVNVGTQSGNRSPVSNLPPIVSCPINALCSFQVPAADADGDPLTYRLSTSAEAGGGGGFTQPGPPQATNAAGISATGLYTWDTTGATLAGSGNTYYSTQVTIEDRDGANAVKSKVALDFLIQLVTVVGNPPVFDSPPTPACNSTQTTTVGGTLTFTVQASDPDMGDIVTLNATGLPPGATMTPPLPTSGNPVSSVFSWTPGAPGTFVVTFTATDQTNQQALCSITVEAQAATNACGSSPNPPCLIEIRPRSMFLDEPVGADNCVGLTINILQGKVSDGTAGVRWLTVAGTAKPTHDYDSAGAVVTFPAGTNALPVTVCINDDNVTEPRESFTVQLVNPVNATIEAPGQKSTIYINSNTN